MQTTNNLIHSSLLGAETHTYSYTGRYHDVTSPAATAASRRRQRNAQGQLAEPASLPNNTLRKRCALLVMQLYRLIAPVPLVHSIMIMMISIVHQANPTETKRTRTDSK